MLIQPVQPVSVLIKIGEIEYIGQLLSLSEEKLELKCEEYIEKDIEVAFLLNIFAAKRLSKKFNLPARFSPIN